MAFRLIFTVTNDLNYDQRMQRIGASLVESGYDVLIIGREMLNSKPLQSLVFEQKRLHCIFSKGFFFYAEYNVRLFIFLLLARYDAVCSIDLDTLPAGCMASLIRRKKRVFDAHEYFTEVPEVVHRPMVKAFWGMVSRVFLPFYRHAYTVGPALADIFTNKYGIPFAVVRNMPLPLPQQPTTDNQQPITNSGQPSNDNRQRTTINQPIILYQGALNEGRGLEQMLEAMTHLHGVKLWLAGEGDLSDVLREKARILGLGDRVRFLGFVLPQDLKNLTSQAWLGLNLLENRGQSYYYSLANKFFDTVQAQVPMLTMNFPEYTALNREFEVAILLPNLDIQGIVKVILQLIQEPEVYQKLKNNCINAAQTWHWENEKKGLNDVWQMVFSK
jgi:glycosyltransferase involved in cell wall biosynthesis